MVVEVSRPNGNTTLIHHRSSIVASTMALTDSVFGGLLGNVRAAAGTAPEQGTNLGGANEVDDHVVEPFAITQDAVLALTLQPTHVKGTDPD